ncbi:MAG: efflux RND transporter periplasmic adaptor subunit [Bacteroidota bacterium]
MKLILKITSLFFILSLFSACNRSDKNTVTITADAEPIVKDGGKFIEFPNDPKYEKLFQVMDAAKIKGMLDLSAPATVVGRVNKSANQNYKSLILFNSIELTNIYSSYLQNLTLLKTSKKNFERVTDLYKNGAATGKEMNDASAELQNIQNSIAGNEAQLRELGLNPEHLNVAPAGTVWLLCDLAESELNSVKKGQTYELEFPGFPDEKFKANIDVIADVVNSDTRKIKIRLSLLDKAERIKPGMYAKVKFATNHEGLMVPKKAVISANAKYYVYIKKSNLLYERREVSISSETGDYIEISSGVNIGEKVVTTNVYLLKGINMGI